MSCCTHWADPSHPIRKPGEGHTSSSCKARGGNQSMLQPGLTATPLGSEHSMRRMRSVIANLPGNADARLKPAAALHYCVKTDRVTVSLWKQRASKLLPQLELTSRSRSMSHLVAEPAASKLRWSGWASCWAWRATAHTRARRRRTSGCCTCSAVGRRSRPRPRPRPTSPTACSSTSPSRCAPHPSPKRYR